MLPVGALLWSSLLLLIITVWILYLFITRNTQWLMHEYRKWHTSQVSSDIFRSYKNELENVKYIRAYVLAREEPVSCFGQILCSYILIVLLIKTIFQISATFNYIFCVYKNENCICVEMRNSMFHLWQKRFPWCGLNRHLFRYTRAKVIMCSTTTNDVYIYTIRDKLSSKTSKVTCRINMKSIMGVVYLWKRKHKQAQRVEQSV